MPARLHLYSTLAVCFLVVVSGQCPDDVLQRVQLCLINSDVFTLYLHFLNNAQEAQDLCEVNVQKAHDCIALLKTQCSSSGQVNAYSLMVDEQRIGDALQTFCRAFPDLMKNPRCFDSPATKTNCLANSAHNYSYDVIVDNQSPHRFILDRSCVYYVQMEQCFLGSFPKGCENESAIFSHVFSAMKFPYCSMSEQDKNIIFPTTTPTTPSTTTPTTTASTTPITKPATKFSTQPSTKPSTEPSTKPSTEPSLGPSVGDTREPPVTTTTRPVTAGHRIAASIALVLCAVLASLLYPLVT